MKKIMPNSVQNADSSRLVKNFSDCGKFIFSNYETAEDLTEFKAKFTFVIVPVMAVKFVQKILKYENPPDVLNDGAAIALTVFNFFSCETRAGDLMK